MKRLALILSILGLSIGQQATRPIVLSWQISASPNVIGYNVYKSYTSGGVNGVYTKMNATPITGLSFTDSSELIGSSIYYVATSVAPACTTPPTGVCGESDYSPEVAVINLPAKPGAPQQVHLDIP